MVHTLLSGPMVYTLFPLVFPGKGYTLGLAKTYKMGLS